MVAMLDLILFERLKELPCIAHWYRLILNHGDPNAEASTTHLRESNVLLNDKSAVL